MKFEDVDFDLEKDENRVVEHAGQRLRISRPPTGYKFISGGISVVDINQGYHGSCWFLSGVASLANFAHQSIIEQAIHAESNSTAAATSGRLEFTFYTFDGKRTVTIDDRLPEAQINEMAKGGDYWMALFEKAYAKFNGSYKSIDGGYPRTSMWHLTGGISIDMDTDWLAATETEEKTAFYFNILKELSATYGKENKRRIVIAAGNLGHSDGTEKDEKGLVSFHAYSVLQIKELVNKAGDKVRLVKVRNPHGLESSEWQGKWSDESEEWNQLSDGDRRSLLDDSDDGIFWINGADFLRYFETVSFCLLPGSWSVKDHQIDITGTFVEGHQVGLDGEEYHARDEMLQKGYNLQFLLEVNANDVELWLQLLLDIHNINNFDKHFVTMALYKGLTDDKKTSTSAILKDRIETLDFVTPMLPYTEKKDNLNLMLYDSNGQLYGKLERGSYLVVLSYMENQNSGLDKQSVDYRLRFVSPDITVTPIFAPGAAIN